jgi:hypothetical protein
MIEAARGRGVWLAAALLLGACGAGTRSPVGAVRALAEAAADGDREEVWRLLGPNTRARLEADARRAAEQSGRRVQPPMEMLAVGWFPPRFRVADVREVERAGDRATVEVWGKEGQRELVTCVRVSQAWKVELP